MPGVSVELINVGKRFGSRQLFAGLNAALAPGECLTIQGKNGSGKSTLLKAIAGFIRPSSGTIKIIRDGQTLDPEQRIAITGLVSPEVIFISP